MAVYIGKKRIPTKPEPSAYDKLPYGDLTISHKNLIDLITALHVRELTVHSDGSICIYYKDTMAGPIKILGVD